MKTNFTKFLLLIIVLGTLVPAITNAQLDPRCFTEDQCIGARKNSGITNDKEARDGFYTNDEATAVCGGEHPTTKKKLGLCLPSTKTVTEISFGGKREFANIGEFIQIIYRYAIIIAGILATVIIMIGGIRWTASGGNAERVKSAQKMISGSVIGLVLALLSFSLLAAINPATVNLRLPQVWLVNKQELNPVYCNQYKEEPGLAPFKRGTEVTPATIEKLRKDGKFDTTKDTSQCGQEYLLAGPSGQICKGLSCTPKTDQVCAPSWVANKFVYNCKKGVLAGRIAGIGGIFSDLTGSNQGSSVDDLVDVIKLIAVCKDGTIEEVGSQTGGITGLPGPDPNNTYVLETSTNEVTNACKKEPIGFYLGVEVNDETFGLDGTAASAGNDDWFAIGQVSPGSKNCQTNLSKIAYRLTQNQEATCKSTECSCQLLSHKEITSRLVNNIAFTNHLISPEDLAKGYNCDIVISRQEFPAVDNANFRILGGILPDLLDDDTSCFEEA
jgi:hypothetical protein